MPALAPAPQRRISGPPLKVGYRLESDRLRSAIEWWLSSDPAEDSCPPAPSFFLRAGQAEGKRFSQNFITGRTPGVLAELSGVNPRRIYGIRSGAQANVSLDVADRLLVAMDLVFLFYLPASQGGFSDVYFHPAVIGGDPDAR